MNLIKRLRNIWRLSGQEITKIGFTDDGRVFHAFGNPDPKRKPQMAQIIKKKSQEQIINEVLNNE